jgi:hypothetical protein
MLLTIYSITLYRTATTPVESTSTEGQVVQTTNNLQSLVVEEGNNSDIPRPPQVPPASNAVSNAPEKLRFVALTDPKMVPAFQATWLSPDDVILGIVHDGEAQAFPLKQMAFHHVVNAEVGGEYYLITYCELCNGYARGFKSAIDDTRYTFNIYGIYEESLALIDRQTSSVWHQSDGQIMSGPLASQRLSLQPQILTRATWEDWQALYPESIVLPQYPDYMDQYSQVTLYNDSSQSQEASPFYKDTRLPANTVVLGTNVGNLFRAYVIEARDDGLSVINDNLDGTPIVIVFDHNNGIGRVFNASIEDQTLSFSIEDNRIVDSTGSRWDSSGRAQGGEYRGSQLSPVASLLTRWFSWSAYHQETSIYGQ